MPMKVKKYRAMNINTRGQKLLHYLLISPKARVWRHILLIMALFSVSFNQTYIIFQNGIPVLGDKLYLIALSVFATYLVVAYYNIFVLIPKYLIQKKYVLYSIGVSVSVILLLWAQNTIEDITRSFLGEAGMDYFSSVTWVNNISSFCTISLCLAGGAITVLLKHWMQENQHVSQLEKMHIQSEVEQLKEQVNPQLLFNILDKTGKLAEEEPDESSRMLFKLSQLLRYQLYDCSRNTVLLDAEIHFLTNYLSLEQMYSRQFEYEISSEGAVKRQFIPPLLFIPFVQWCVMQVYERDKRRSIQLLFNAYQNRVEFTCNHDIEVTPGKDDFSRIRQRLSFLYKTNYSLSFTGHSIQLTLKHAES